MSHLVYRDLDQQALDLAYRPAATVPDVQAYIDDWARTSAAARETLTCRRGIAYGNAADELLDVFPARNGNAPVHIFFHGGFWRRLSKDESSYHAKTYVDAGAAYVAVNYSLAPQASLDTIVDQCRRAIVWTHKNAASLNADPNRIFIAGHSAGGQLVGMMAVTDWPAQFGLPANLVKGSCAISGLYDLEPVRLSEVNGWMNLDVQAARRNSPIFSIPDAGCAMIVAWGDRETGEFVRQSREFGDAWTARGLRCEKIEEKNHNHFSVVGLLADPASALGGATLRQMGLT